MRDRLDAGRSSSTTRRCRTSDDPQGVRRAARRSNQPPLIDVLLHKRALHRARRPPSASRSAPSSASRSASCSSHSRLLQRGFLPYIVASPDDPDPRDRADGRRLGQPEAAGPLQGWGAVAVIAAYLTFFPVAINTLRGLQSADPRALELMRTYAAEPLGGALEAARAGLAAVRLRGAEDRGDRERRRRDHRRAAVVDSRTASAARSSTSTSTTRSSRRSCGRRTSSRRCSGSSSSSLVVARREARRPPRTGARRMSDARAVVSISGVTKTFPRGTSPRCRTSTSSRSRASSSR